LKLFFCHLRERSESAPVPPIAPPFVKTMESVSVAVLGPPKIGKTAIQLRFVDESASSSTEYIPTVTNPAIPTNFCVLARKHLSYPACAFYFNNNFLL
jgi:hypothetical protein